MSDIFTKEKRSKIMSKVSTKGTKPELLVRKYLFSQGFRYRINLKGLIGTPDIVLSRYKTVIFVNGCFWHGHNCKAGHRPSSNTTYWNDKISQNIERDARNIKMLEDIGWHVITIWQCEIKNAKLRDARFQKLTNEIRINLQY